MSIFNKLTLYHYAFALYMFVEHLLGKSRFGSLIGFAGLSFSYIFNSFINIFLPSPKEGPFLMNAELKAMLALVFDVTGLVEKAVAGENFMNLLSPIFVALTSDLPPIVANFGDLMNEIQALPGSEQEADLIAYIEKRFPEVVSDKKAPAILDASLKLLVCAWNLKVAFTG